MRVALDSDSTCLFALMAAALYHIQKGEFQKAVETYRVILTSLSLIQFLIYSSS